MFAIAIFTGSVVVAIVGAVLCECLRERRTAVRRRVVVNIDNGDAIDGLLWARRGRLLVLKDARLLMAGREATVMDGEVVIDRAHIRFVQAL